MSMFSEDNCEGNCNRPEQKNQPEESKADIYNIGLMLYDILEKKMRLIQLKQTIFVVLRDKKVFCKVTKPVQKETLLVEISPDYVQQFVKGTDTLNPMAMVEDACEKISMVLGEIVAKGTSLFELRIPTGVGIEGDKLA